MPLQNRVTPTGEIVATAERGSMMGNRGGRIHDAGRRLRQRRWASRQWICCVLAFRGRRRHVMAPNSYTELFFLDEATALAAGHRPCFECRRGDAMRFATMWNASRGLPGRAMAGEMDRVLHAERTSAGQSAKHLAAVSFAEAVDGTFVVLDEQPHLFLEGHLLAWSHSGYGRPSPWPPGARLVCLTPASIRRIFALGYQPMVHPTAGRRPPLGHSPLTTSNCGTRSE